MGTGETDKLSKIPPPTPLNCVLAVASFRTHRHDGSLNILYSFKPQVPTQKQKFYGGWQKQTPSEHLLYFIVMMHGAQLASRKQIFPEFLKYSFKAFSLPDEEKSITDWSLNVVNDYLSNVWFMNLFLFSALWTWRRMRLHRCLTLHSYSDVKFAELSQSHLDHTVA